MWQERWQERTLGESVIYIVFDSRRCQDINTCLGKKDRHLSEAAAEGVKRIRKEAVEPSAGMLADLVSCGFPDVDGHNLAKTGAAVHEHEVLEPVNVFPDQTDSIGRQTALAGTVRPRYDRKLRARFHGWQ